LSYRASAVSRRRRWSRFRVSPLILLLAALTAGGRGAAESVIADGAWHELPGSGRTLSQPVGILIPGEKNTQYANSIGVVIRGADQGVYHQNYFLGFESWSGHWSSLNAQAFDRAGNSASHAITVTVQPR
jgi:hypothetical protein